MNKHTLTLEFASLDDLHGAVDRLLGREVVSFSAPGLTPEEVQRAIRNYASQKEDDAARGTLQAQRSADEQQKPPRKPRNDAGKPRGPYKLGQDAKAGDAGAPEATTGGAPAASPAASPAAASPSVSPDARAAEQRTVNPPEAGANPVGGPPTIDDARAALKSIKDTAGLGTAACIGHLNSFGVDRFTLVPKEQYAAFIKSAAEMVAKAKGAK